MGADKVPRLNVLDLQASHAAALGSQSHSSQLIMRMPWALTGSCTSDVGQRQLLEPHASDVILTMVMLGL